MEKHVIYIAFVDALFLAVKSFNTDYFPFVLFFLIFITFYYSIRFRAKELVFGVSIVLFLSFASFTFHSNEEKNRVIFIKETPGGNHFAYLSGHKVLFVEESVQVGDVVDEKGKIVEKRNPVLGFLEDLRISIYEGIKDNLDYPISSLVGAITLGIRQELPSSVKVYFSLSGLYPFLAISGLHVGIVIGFLSFIFKLLKIKRSYTTACLVLLPLMPLTGLPPSAVRAYLLALFISLGLENFRKVSPIYLLGVVFLFTLAFNEESIGATLSFLAVFGIFLALSIEGNIKKAFFVSLAPMLFTLPVVLYLFGTVNLASFINSYIATLIFTPLLALSFLGEITFFKVELINEAINFFGKLFILLSQYLYELTKVFIIHSEIPLFLAAGAIVLALILSLKNKPLSFIPLSLLIVYAILFPTKVENKTIYLKGWELHSFSFLSTKGQALKNCKIYANYVFPFARKFLEGNTLLDKRLKRSKL